MDASARWDKVTHWFRQQVRKHFTWWAGLIIVFELLYTGVGVVPREFYREVASNPYMQRTDVHPENHFQESPLLPVAAHLAGWQSRGAFNALCFAFIAASLLFLLQAARRRYGGFWALLLLMLLLAHPVIMVLFSWLGTPDSITFFVLALLLYARQKWLVFFLVLVGAYNHPIVMFAAPAILLLRWLARENGIRLWHVLCGGAGGGAGWLLVRIFLHINSIAVVSRAEYVESRSLAFWLQYNLVQLPLALFSLHNVVWVALAVALFTLWRLERRYVVVFLLLQVFFYGVTFFCLDTTRVFALLAWAAAWHCVGYALQRSERGPAPARQRLEQKLLLVALISLLTPTYYSYLGEFYYPGQNEFHLLKWICSRI